MTSAEIAETLRGAAEIVKEEAGDSGCARLWAAAVAIEACASAAEEAWEREA